MLLKPSSIIALGTLLPSDHLLYFISPSSPPLGIFNYPCVLIAQPAQISAAEDKPLSRCVCVCVCGVWLMEARCTEPALQTTKLPKTEATSLLAAINRPVKNI